MPWEVKPRGGKFDVVRKGSGDVVSTHTTAGDAQAKVKELYASEVDKVSRRRPSGRRDALNVPYTAPDE